MKAISARFILVTGLLVQGCVYVPPVWEQATEEEIRSIKVGVTDRETIIEYFGEPNVLDHERFIVHRGREDWGFILFAAGSSAGGGLINEKNSHLAIEFDDAGIVKHLQVERGDSEESVSRNVTSLRRHLRVPEERHDFGISLAFSSTGRYLAVGDSGNRVFLWDLRSGEEPRVFTGEKSCGAFSRCDVGAIAFSPDETKLAAAMVDNSVVVWDITTGRRLFSLDVEWNDFWGGDYVTALSFTYDGRALATADSDGQIAVWDGATGQLLQDIEAHKAGIFDLAYTRDGRWLITVSQDGTAKLWATDPLSEIDNIERGVPLTSVGLSEDGSQLAIASKIHVELWGMDDRPETDDRSPIGALLHVFVMPVRDGHSYIGQSIAISPDKQRLIGVAGSAVIWNAEKRQIEAELMPGSNCCNYNPSISAAAFHPEGNLIATAGNDGVKLWDSR